MHLARALIVSLALLLLAGCATWTRGGAPHTNKAGYTITLPASWTYHPNAGGRLVATRDGIVLQEFAIIRLKLPHELPKTKRSLTAALTPYELSEALADERKTIPAFGAYSVVARDAVRLDGHDGFRFDSRHVTEEGLNISMRTWGVVVNDVFYLIDYAAPTRHYHARDLAAISEAVERITFASSAPAAR